MSVHRSAAQPMPDMVGEQPLASADYTVENKGTLLLLRSSNGRAYDWLVTHTIPTRTGSAARWSSSTATSTISSIACAPTASRWWISDAELLLVAGW